jgi:hypothetical protein
MLKSLLIAASLSLLPATVLAAPGHDHGHPHSHDADAKGSHGGTVQPLAGFEAELVVDGGTVTLYLLDAKSHQPITTEGMQASILFTQGSTRKGTLTLLPAGDHLQATGTAPAGADAVVSLRTKDGKSGQARFELGGHSH